MGLFTLQASLFLGGRGGAVAPSSLRAVKKYIARDGIYGNLHSGCLTSDQNYWGIDVEGSGGDDPDELSGGSNSDETY